MRKNFIGGSLLTMCLLAGSAHAADYFVDSDDYKEKEEIVDVFLKEADYRLMVEDIERNGEAFDWGWVRTAEAQAAAAAPSEKKGGLMGKIKRGGGRGNPAEPKNLGFSLSSYKTVSIPKVNNYSGMIPPETPDKIRASFVQAMETAGLKVTDGAGDLELEVAIVDYKQDSTNIVITRVDPFIELEMRLREKASGENLMLLRSQSHSNTPEDAAFNYASSLLKFLR